MQVSTDVDVVGLAGGLCVKCAQNDARLPPSVTYAQQRSLERLRKYSPYNDSVQMSR